MAGLAASFGSGAMTGSIADLDIADVILVVGSNTTEAHPVIGSRIRQAARRGARVFVADPRAVDLVKHAERWLPVRPGGNVALANAMMSAIVDAGLVDTDFVRERTEAFEALADLLETFDAEKAAQDAGVALDDIRSAALAYASAERGAIVYSMGVTQHTTGTDQVRALANLAMLTGHVGRPGTGVFPLRGQNNVQGACDMGCLPDKDPGYRQRGECDCGLTSIEMLEAAAQGDLKALYVVGENPVVTDPDQAHVIEALAALDFLVVQDLFLTETAALADVVLPAASFLEKSGTFTNTERRVQLVRQVIDPPGEALPDGEIVARLSSAMGVPFEFEPEAVMAEIAAAVPQYAGVSHERLNADKCGLQWPVPEASHPGTPTLHAEKFARGLGAFAAVDHRAPTDAPTPDRPLVLTTGRELWSFHANSMTGRSEGLADLDCGACIELSAEDAKSLGIAHGDTVEVESTHGSVRTSARVLPHGAVRPGTAFMPFHHAESPANRLTGGAVDPVSGIPSLKATAVRVTKVEV